MFERASVRVNPRTPVRVEIGTPGQPTTLGVVSNISDHGACVVTDGRFPIGESLVLQLVFSPDTQPLQAAGRVVWMRPASESAGAQRYLRYPIEMEELVETVGEVIAEAAAANRAA